jgi:putative peptide zinc metalloprotease protein
MISQQLMAGLRPNFRGEARQRVVLLRAVTAVAAFAAGLAWAWGPDGGTARPDDSAPGAVRVPAASHAAPVMRIEPAGWQHPATPWVFPFDRPSAPEEDGNQALAVNTTDGSVIYSVEFALVWADDGEPVDTRNEAYAFANCTGCAAVAVGFQEVLIEDQPEVIAPGNHSAAVNYNCTECNTHALASQLVLTVDCGLSDDGMEQLSALWEEIDAYGTNLQDVPLSEVQPRLEAYKQEIIAIVQADPSATEDGTETSTETGDDESPEASLPAPTQPA